MDLSSSAFGRYAPMLALTLTLLISSGVAVGQEGNAVANGAGSSEVSGPVKPQLDDATLKRTAKAFVKVKRIVASAQQEIDRSSNDQQKQNIAAQAETDKLDAVKAEGLQPRQYNQVLVLARTDKALRDKLLSYVDRLEKSP
jgi:Domain of unknown function (DUF4168)